MDKIKIECPSCKKTYSAIGFNFNCPEGCDALPQTKYKEYKTTEKPGIYRYLPMLPIQKTNDYKNTPILIENQELNELLGKEIVIAFHGYHPEINAEFETCTFKEIEAVCSLRYAAEQKTNLALASVGNTANAFLRHSDKEEINTYIFVPEKTYEDLFTTKETDNSKLIVIEDASYSEAQKIAKKFTKNRNVEYDGGGKNIARRDSLSTLAYQYYEEYGDLPDHYYQPIGSGTGAIAFHTGCQRLKNHELIQKTPSIHIAQNEPFTPVVDAWNNKTRSLPQTNYNPLEKTYSKVLTNKNPLYSIKNGLYDILNKTNGTATKATKKEAKKAGRKFKEIIDIDLYPAAEVGLASLMKTKLEGKILLNITGAGRKKLKETKNPITPEPDYIIQKTTDLDVIE